MTLDEARKKLAELDQQIEHDKKAKQEKGRGRSIFLKVIILLLIGAALAVLSIYLPAMLRGAFPEKYTAESAPRAVYVKEFTRDSEGHVTLYLGVEDQYYSGASAEKMRTYPFKYNVVRLEDRATGVRIDRPVQIEPGDGSGPPSIVLRDPYLDGLKEGLVDLSISVIGMDSSSDEAIVKQIKFSSR